MGSSPVTATNLLMSRVLVERTLEQFFRPLLKPRSLPERVLVAFSGGADSTALLAGLASTASRLGVEVRAAHLDHGLDPDSSRRARAAERLAAEIGVALHVERPEAPLDGRSGTGREAAARRARYGFLARYAGEIGARFVATAHHADDQAETLLLRMAFGSGLEGLAGISPRRPLAGSDALLVRPLLTLRRRELQAGVEGRFRPVDDATNADLSIPRNRVRHRLLPRLEGEEPELVPRLAGMARAAAAARRRVEEVLLGRLQPRPVPYETGVQVSRAAFEALPEALAAHALALLHRLAGAPYPAAAAARRELARQLAGERNRRAGCDCGDGWRWEAASGLLLLLRGKPSGVEFTYSLEAPGEVEIPELRLLFRLRRGDVAPWMYTSCPDRAGLADLLGDARLVEVRSRRPGDRIVPLGSSGRRRLKEVLIDAQVPRRQRHRLPLLVVDGEIAWVPGVALAERFRLPAASDGPARAWIAEIEPLRGSPQGDFRGKLMI